MSHFRGIHVKETFLVYSSTLAVVDMEVKNTDNIPHEITVYPVLELGNDSLEIMNYNDKDMMAMSRIDMKVHSV